MNVVDMAILAVLGLFLVKGLVRGLLKELCSLLGLFGGLAVAMRFHPLLKTFSMPRQLGVIIAFVTLFLLTALIFAIIGFILSRFVKLLFLGGFNRVAGGLFGLLQGGAILILVLYGLSRSPLPESVQKPMLQSRLAPPLVEMGASLFRYGGPADSAAGSKS
jgi:membrane protein required for colicin V production